MVDVAVAVYVASGAAGKSAGYIRVLQEGPANGGDRGGFRLPNTPFGRRIAAMLAKKGKGVVMRAGGNGVPVSVMASSISDGIHLNTQNRRWPQSLSPCCLLGECRKTSNLACLQAPEVVKLP